MKRSKRDRKAQEATIVEAVPCPAALPPDTPTYGRIVRFNWSRHWKSKVEPYLDLPLVRLSVEMGMKLYDPKWTWEDGPHAIGRGSLNGQRVSQEQAVLVSALGPLPLDQFLRLCHWRPQLPGTRLAIHQRQVPHGPCGESGR
jgi:hypothetical protein